MHSWTHVRRIIVLEETWIRARQRFSTSGIMASTIGDECGIPLLVSYQHSSSAFHSRNILDFSHGDANLFGGIISRDHGLLAPQGTLRAHAHDIHLSAPISYPTCTLVTIAARPLSPVHTLTAGTQVSALTWFAHDFRDQADCPHLFPPLSLILACLVTIVVGLGQQSRRHSIIIVQAAFIVEIFLGANLIAETIVVFAPKITAQEVGYSSVRLSGVPKQRRRPSAHHE